MLLTKLECGFWILGFVAESILLTVLLVRRALLKEPWFVAWIGFNCASTVLLFSVIRFPALYFLSFWGRALLDMVLQLAVLGEIASTLITGRAQLRSEARHVVYRCICLSLPLALGVTIAEHPAATNQFNMFFARANLFMTVVFCVTLGGIIARSSSLGIAWSDNVTRKSYGLVVWNLCSFTLDSLHSNQHTVTVFADLEYLRSASFLLVLVYWIAVYARGTVLRQSPQRRIEGIKAYIAGKGLTNVTFINQESKTQ